MQVVITKDNEGNKGEVTDTTKVTILLSELQACAKSVAVVFGLQLDG